MAVEAICLRCDHGEDIYLTENTIFLTLKSFYGYMYAVRTYHHSEVFYTISARKLTGKVMKFSKNSRDDF